MKDRLETNHPGLDNPKTHDQDHSKKFKQFKREYGRDMQEENDEDKPQKKL